MLISGGSDLLAVNQTCGDSRIASKASPHRFWWQRWDPRVEDVPTRITDRPTANSFVRDSDQYEGQEGFVPADFQDLSYTLKNNIKHPDYGRGATL